MPFATLWIKSPLKWVENTLNWSWRNFDVNNIRSLYNAIGYILNLDTISTNHNSKFSFVKNLRWEKKLSKIASDDIYGYKDMSKVQVISYKLSLRILSNYHYFKWWTTIWPPKLCKNFWHKFIIAITSTSTLLYTLTYKSQILAAVGAWWFGGSLKMDNKYACAVCYLFRWWRLKWGNYSIAITRDPFLHLIQRKFSWD